jgi:hypothetical protein
LSKIAGKLKKVCRRVNIEKAVTADICAARGLQFFKAIMKILKIIKWVLFFIVQWTWGFLQSFLGLMLFIRFRHCKRFGYHGALGVLHDAPFGGVSLGMFFFVNGARDEKWIKESIVHEYGHCVQSLLLGPFYLFVIGIPSIVWCNAKRNIKKRETKGVSYYSFYPEKYANRLGEAVAKESAPSLKSGIPKAFFENKDAPKD